MRPFSHSMFGVCGLVALLVVKHATNRIEFPSCALLLTDNRQTKRPIRKMILVGLHATNKWMDGSTGWKKTIPKWSYFVQYSHTILCLSIHQADSAQPASIYQNILPVRLSAYLSLGPAVPGIDVDDDQEKRILLFKWPLENIVSCWTIESTNGFAHHATWWLLAAGIQSCGATGP